MSLVILQGCLQRMGKGKGREGRELNLLMRSRPESECRLNGTVIVRAFRRRSSLFFGKTGV